MGASNKAPANFTSTDIPGSNLPTSKTIEFFFAHSNTNKNELIVIKKYQSEEEWRNESLNIKKVQHGPNIVKFIDQIDEGNERKFLLTKYL